ncbi:MAG: HupE/UreJ family protein [Gammaproteobacteria bacterium]|nr:HupE/UreJ family protein [Sideroxydans sp.]MBU3904284.1 HupE/UreJ family protein [Gammaproteobacteria bacterium]MBU4045652.1 HupE/UreJ family protein [Gammaproteobacteria bacterium]
MKRTLITLALLFINTAASAHTGHDSSGFTTGLVHPFSGMDHLLAMLAVGLWAGQLGGQRIWQLPATFMAMLVGGAFVPMWVPSLTLIEPGIAASVLILGLLIASPTKLAIPISFALTAAFGLFHGYAHGSEMPSAAAPLAYAAGFLLATASLHVSGIVIGSALRERFTRLVQVVGMSIAAMGAWMLVTI